MVQPLIQIMVKKMRMTGNLAKRKRNKEEPTEEERDLEVFSNEKHFVKKEKFSFSQSSQFLYQYHNRRILEQREQGSDRAHCLVKPVIYRRVSEVSILAYSLFSSERGSLD